MNATRTAWRTAILAGLIVCVGAPGLAAHAKGKAKVADHGWIDGLWESQWPGDQLRKPGDPPRPVEVGPAPLKAEYLAKYQAAQKAIDPAVVGDLGLALGVGGEARGADADNQASEDRRPPGGARGVHGRPPRRPAGAGSLF